MAPDEAAPRSVRRGEGEVTQWPRGLVGYTPSGPDDDTPDPDEDRTGNRIRLAARLLSVLAAQGAEVGSLVQDLAAAERAYRAGRHDEATRRVETILEALARFEAGPGAHGPPTR